MEMYNFRYKNLTKGILIGCLILVSSCKKFIEVDPPITSVNGANVYNENSNAAAVLTGLYAKIAAGSFSLSLSAYPDLYSDNLSLYSQQDPLLKSYFQNALTATTAYNYWETIYSYVYITNSAIEGLNQSSGLDQTVKTQLLGEAYFMRGFLYFYLVNIYGEVPIILTTDYKTNSSLAKSPTDKIYSQLIEDLKTAKELLDDRYLDASVLKETDVRVRPTRMAATAMLARAYLYTKAYKEAENESTELIKRNELFSLVDLNDVFVYNSRETIWALQPVKDGITTDEGYFYIFPDGGPGSANTLLSPSLINSFENGDQRKIKWIGSMKLESIEYFYPFKYKVHTLPSSTNKKEFTTILRLGEQYLIRAEARIHQNNISGGINDLNALRQRSTDLTASEEDRLSQIPTTISNTQALEAVYHERRVELFTEWGNRWFDLKRTETIDQVMGVETALKGGIWEPYKALHPIPRTEIQANRKITQNTGYQ